MVIFVSFVIGFGLGTKVRQAQTQKTDKMTEPSPTPVAMYTLEDVAVHNTKDDCWQVIDGIVCDFTAYIASDAHPGG